MKLINLLEEALDNAAEPFFFRPKDRVYGSQPKSVLHVIKSFANVHDALAKYPNQKQVIDAYMKGAIANMSDPNAPWYAVGSKSKNGNYLTNTVVVPEEVLKKWGGYDDNNLTERKKS